ncbi:MAG: metallophosphoesterase family protein [Pseudomonadota bacterium]
MIGEFLRAALFGVDQEDHHSGVAVDRPLYAIGDVHGCSDLLEGLVESILQDHIARNDDDVKPELLFLGDLIDKGPDSAATVEFVAALQEWPEIDLVTIRGNHEQMLLEFLANPAGNVRWVQFGGYDTVLSYGVRMRDMRDPGALAVLAAELREAMGSHIDLLSRMPVSHINGNVLCVHAGADPEVAPEMQSPHDLLWGVPSFYRERRQDGMWVVHGHTIVDAPAIADGRISVDTGAYCNGLLTAARLDGSSVGFLVQSSRGCEII